MRAASSETRSSPCSAAAAPSSPPQSFRCSTTRRVPYLFPYASLGDLVQPVKKSIFALLPINQDQISGLIRYVVKKEGAGAIYGIYTKVPGAEQAAVANGAAAKDVGATWNGYEMITPGSTDFTPIVLRLKQSHPDYLVLNMLEPDAGRLFIAMRDQNWFPKRMLGTSSLSSGAAFQAVGRILDGKLVAMSPTVPAGDPKAAGCAEALAAQSVPVSGFSLFGCGTAQAFVHAPAGGRAAGDPRRAGQGARFLARAKTPRRCCRRSAFPPATTWARPG